MKKGVRIIFILFGIILISCSTIAQGLFHPVQKESVQFSKKSISPPDKYHAYTVEENILHKALKQAMTSNTAIELPLADGSTALFKVAPYSVAGDGFYERYPSIITFKLTQVNGKIKGYGDHTEHGFHAVLHGEEGLTYIDPTHIDNSQRAYAVYYTKDYSRGEDAPVFECETDETFVQTEEPGNEINTSGSAQLRSSAADSVPVRTYKLAALTTAEYSNYHGGTEEAVASELATLLVRVNEIMLREWSIKYELIDSTHLLFFYDSDDDNLTNGNTSQLINEGASIIQSTIFTGNYDIGHVFCTNAGGLATVASVCRSNKARGVSCGVPPIGDNYYVDIVCHEIGHQMGSSHSFNYCRGNNESLGKGYEPGSGVTIMAYAGLCGPRNTQTFTDPYYNIGSIESIIAYMHNGAGRTCADITERSNTPPTVHIPYEDGFFIPISTPFELHASASDETEDLLYCWEGHDAGSVNCEPGSPSGTCPLFRSFEPTRDSFRIFPELRDIVSGNFDRWEVLPTYSRHLSFACTVRDWEPEGGALAWDFVNFEATESAGPFEVDPISGEYEVGDQLEVTWDVANTDQAPVNCQFVDIYLSTDGGSSFPHLWAEDVPNLGSVKLNLPNLTTFQGKVKVKAANNIFFNISDLTFRVNPPSQAGFIASVTPFAQQVCLPATADIQIATEPFLSFSEMISVIEVNGLPPSAQFNVSPQIVSPGETVNINFNFIGSAEGTYPIEIVLAGGSDTVRVETQATVVSNDFSELVGTLPAQNAENLSQLPFFRWDTVQDADLYQLQVADYPTFDQSTIIYESNELTVDTHRVAGLLPKNTLLYWRVVPINECGKGTPSPIRVFHTEAQACQVVPSDDVPRAIPTSGSAEVNSKVNIVTTGVISDVNVLNLRGTHSYIGELKAFLLSPSGTQVKLIDTECFNLQDFYLSLDDEAPIGITCPITTKRTMRPRGKLSDFNGEETAGEWTLKLTDNVAGFGGELTGWTLELCGSISVSKPSFSSDTVYLDEKGSSVFLNETHLQASKSNIPDYLIRYTVIEPPKYGSVSYTGSTTTFKTGSQFTQDDINNYWLEYDHDGSNDTVDFMSFTISDEEGGWLGLDTVFFVVDSTLSTKTIPNINFSVFPNPANDQFMVHLPEIGTEGDIQLINMQGQLISKQQLNGNLQYRFNAIDLPKGMYFIKVTSDEGRGTKRIVIQ